MRKVALMFAAGLLVAASTSFAHEPVDEVYNVVKFPDGGLTLVWVLAESHLVLHYWGAEGFATIDLHICDYRDSNRAKAQRLVETLESSCFLPGTAQWHEISVAEPQVPTPLG